MMSWLDIAVHYPLYFARDFTVLLQVQYEYCIWIASGAKFHIWEFFNRLQWLHHHLKSLIWKLFNPIKIIRQCWLKFLYYHIWFIFDYQCSNPRLRKLPRGPKFDFRVPSELKAMEQSKFQFDEFWFCSNICCV